MATLLRLPLIKIIPPPRFPLPPLSLATEDESDMFVENDPSDDDTESSLRGREEDAPCDEDAPRDDV